MSKDYKSDITKYLTEERLEDWWNKSDSGYRELLETLGVFTYEKISEVFKGEDNILKFFWYKLLTRENMPANVDDQFDCDKVFFGRYKKIPPSNLVNEWQQRKENWKPDTANSFTRLFRRFLALYLPNIFPSTLPKSDGREIKFKAEWTNNLLHKIKSTDDSYEMKYKRLKKCHFRIAAYEKKMEVKFKLKSGSKYDNQLRFFSYLILFQEELFRQLKENCESELRSMQCFAKLTHTPGNFILVTTKDHYDNVKNNRYGDFIDLYIKHQNEEFIEEQKLSMYKEELFMRREHQVFPDKNSFMTCIDNINKKIIQREKELE